MKLRNRRTGVIRDTEKWVFSVSDKGILFGDTAYNSLAELCKEWEDYEEPKEYWYIDEWGNIQDTDYYNDQYDNAAKEIGNKFETKEEAEKAVEKLKAWKRLKDKGFCPKIHKTGQYLSIEANYGVLEGDYRDLVTVFGGEE